MRFVKYAVGILAAALVATMLYVVSAVPASSSSPAADPYPRTVKTVCIAKVIKRTHRVGQKGRIRLTIRENSTDQPRVRIAVVKKRKTANGGFKNVKGFRPKRYYFGKPSLFPFTTTIAGTYKVVLKTQFRPRSQFRQCRDSVIFRVRR